MKRNLRMLSFFMALLMVFLCIPVVALDLVATGETSIQTENTEAMGNNESFYDSQLENVLSEDVSKRDAFTKHYDLGNGSYYAVVFPEQVHYFENDQWVEIDNSLQYNSVSGRYESVNQIFSTGFAPNATAGDAVSVTNGDYTVSWSLVFEDGGLGGSLNADDHAELIQPQPALIANGQAFVTDGEASLQSSGSLGKAFSAVTYADLQNGKVDVRYSVYHGKVKEDVVLESADALTSYVKGADVVIGFKVNVVIEEAYLWTEVFMNRIAEGCTIDAAMEAADIEVAKIHKGVDFDRDGNIDTTPSTTDRCVKGNRQLAPCG